MEDLRVKKKRRKMAAAEGGGGFRALKLQVCKFPNCHHTSQTNYCRMKKFPISRHKCIIWLEVCGIQRSPSKIPSQFYMCSFHFDGTNDIPNECVGAGRPGSARTEPLLGATSQREEGLRVQLEGADAARPGSSRTEPDDEVRVLLRALVASHTSLTSLFERTPTLAGAAAAGPAAQAGAARPPPPPPKLPMYDGSWDYAEHAAQCAAVLSGHNDRTKIAALAACLAGPARSFYTTLPRESTGTFDLLSAAFMEAFAKRRAPFHASVAYRSCRQLARESAHAYGMRLLALHRLQPADCAGSPAQVVHFFLDGLRDEALRRDAGHRVFPSLAAAIDWASLYDGPEDAEPPCRVRAAGVDEAASVLDSRLDGLIAAVNQVVARPAAAAPDRRSCSGADTPSPSSKRRRQLPADAPPPPDLQKLVDTCEDISPDERGAGEVPSAQSIPSLVLDTTCPHCPSACSVAAIIYMHEFSPLRPVYGLDGEETRGNALS
ncbi:Centrosomal protein of 170 kDa protein B [Frankliniella fusca]|uniref:Centrosomal protein of 170 kDa protein B n=1 Tax=Frankliniella fusca TaxID=407009 RepID=A0AAE1HQG3_9NEOP|nr:Centrosomal protein of 170 kDa protein B [Frankliniella fusca]